MKITIWPRREVKGWNGGDEELPQLEGFETVEASEGFGRRFDTDAHCVPYYVEGEDKIPRMNKGAVGKAEIRFNGVMADVDAPAEVKDLGLARVWSDEQITKVPEGFGWYVTRGGFRVFADLDEPVGPAVYEGVARAFRDTLRGAGIVVDELPDWTRCYRLPRVLRDGEHQDSPIVMPARPFKVNGIKAAGAFEGIDKIRARVDLASLDESKGRNNELTRAAGKMRHSGMAEDTLGAALLALNAGFSEPLAEDEVLGIARKALRWEAPEPPARADGTLLPEIKIGSEAELAGVVIAELEAGGRPIVFDRECLWRYSTELGIWEPVTTNDVALILCAYDGTRYGKAGVIKVGEAMIKHVAALCGRLRERNGWFDGARPGVCFADVRVASGRKVEPHSPDARDIHALPFKWDPDADCPLFRKVLKDAFGSWHALEALVIREFFGACLMGDATRYQRAIMLTGEGANGKSVILDVGAALFHHSVKSSVPPQELGNEYQRAEFVLSLLNVVSEVPESKILAAESLKAFVTGDVVGARRIYEAPFQFRPKAGHLYAANDLPAVASFAAAFWRRWIVVRFERVIPEAARITHLSRKIIAEELQGVARWAVDGEADLAARGAYEIPETSTEAARNWQEDADQVASFVAESCKNWKIGERKSSSKTYLAYKAWKFSEGGGDGKPLRQKKFTQRMVRLGFSVVKGRDCNLLERVCGWSVDG